MGDSAKHVAKPAERPVEIAARKDITPEKVEVFDIDKYANLVKMITRDLNNRYGKYVCNFIKRYSKEDIIRFLAHPERHEKELRRAVRYVYDASPHFRRLIQYFVGLSDLAYVVSPYRIDPRTANERMINIQYRKTLNQLSIMNIKNEFPKILTVCLREDVFYGTMWISKDTVTIQQLPSDFCAIPSVEGNVCNVAFDFSYFDTRLDRLECYPEEFTIKYEMYKRDKKHKRWIDLDSPRSFAVKCNMDVLGYAIPPFAGILPEIFDIENYKQIKMDGAELDNYAMLAMYIPYKDGVWGIDYNKATSIWKNLDNVLPDQVGSILTPMELEKISFEKTHNNDDDTVTEAERSLFTAAGVSSLIFNNEKASANALLLSIKADQAITFGIVKSIENVVNRYIQSDRSIEKYGKNFKVTFLDCSRYNQKELGDAYLKAASYGLPTISMYAASQGLGQAELDSMSFLENDVLQLQKMFKPLINSAQVSADIEGATDEGGAPEKDVGELTDAGEISRERDGE